MFALQSSGWLLLGLCQAGYQVAVFQQPVSSEDWSKILELFGRGENREKERKKFKFKLIFLRENFNFFFKFFSFPSFFPWRKRKCSHNLRLSLLVNRLINVEVAFLFSPQIITSITVWKQHSSTNSFSAVDGMWKLRWSIYTLWGYIVS